MADSQKSDLDWEKRCLEECQDYAIVGQRCEDYSAISAVSFFFLACLLLEKKHQQTEFVGVNILFFLLVLRRWGIHPQATNTGTHTHTQQSDSPLSIKWTPTCLYQLDVLKSTTHTHKTKMDIDCIYMHIKKQVCEKNSTLTPARFNRPCYECNSAAQNIFYCSLLPLSTKHFLTLDLSAVLQLAVLSLSML